MVYIWQKRGFVGGIGLGMGAIALFGSPVVAQITPDNTLGGERSQVNRDVTVRGRLGHLIGGGAVRGVNLFHSFQEFNVNNGQRVYFSNPTGIENILSRVTGNTISDINGTLGVDGMANLFLLNPNGIVFGPNARLDVSGSFVGSTGDRFTFGDGSNFSATNPQAPPLLTMRVPIGLQYGTGTITNQGQLTTGQDLTLAGQRLDLQGQLQVGRNLTLQASTVQIRDSVTTPFIASAGGEMVVQGDRTVDIFALNNPNSGFFSNGDMTLRSQNPVSGDAHYWSGGNFRIERLNGAVGDLVSPYDPIILAIGDVVLGDVLNTASLHILAGGSVTVGDIEVTSIGDDANTINPANPNPFLAALATNGIPQTVNSGVPGSPRRGVVDGASRFFVDIRAGVDWSQIPGFPGNTVIDAPTPPPAGATTADIRVNSINFTGSVLGGVVYLTNQYQPNGLTSPNGIVIGSIDTGGDDGGGSVAVDSRSGITLNGGVITSALNLGSSGDVSFQAVGDITFNPGSSIDSSSINSDSAIPFSTVRIESTNGSVLLNNALISATNSGTELAGDIFIDAGDRIEIRNNSRIAAEGNSGRIFIGSNSDTVGADPTAPTTVLLDNSQLQTTNRPITAAGDFDAGDIRLRATRLISVTNGSQINAATFREGDAGNIQVDAGAGDIRVEGVGIPAAGQLQTVAFSTVEAGGNGDAGNIIVTGGSLFLGNGAEFQTLIREGAQGNAGDVSIGLTGAFTANDGEIFSQVGAGTGNSGDIVIEAGSVDLSNGSLLQAANLSTGLAGDITVDSQGQLAITNSTVEATSNNNVSDASSVDNYSEIRLNALTGSVVLTGATVTTTNSGTGTDSTTDADDGIAGDVLINARDRVVIQDQSTIASRGRLGRILIGNTLVPTQVEILNNPEDPTNRDEQHGLIADGFAGRVEITAGDRLQISNSRITTRSDNDTENPDTFGRMNLTAETGSVLIDSGALLSSTNFGIGFAGDININARDLISITDGSGIFSQGQQGRIFIGGSSDEIAPPQQTQIRGNVLISTDNGFINDSTERAGSIIIRGRDRVEISDSQLNNRSRNETNNFSQIQVAATEGSVFLNAARLSTTNADTGLAGDIVITAPNLISITNGSEISSEGNFGRILIGDDFNSETQRILPNRIRIRNTRLSTSNQIDDDSIAENDQVFGRAGNIQLLARQRVDINNPVPRAGVPPSRFSILSETVGDDPAGNITIVARRGAVNIRGGFISSRTGLDVLGSGGNITVQGRSVDIRNGAQLSTSTFGLGNAGNVGIIARRDVVLDNADLFSTVASGAGSLSQPVSGGFISVTGRSLTMTNGAQLQTQVNGSTDDGTRGGVGNAGSVLVGIRDRVTLDGGGTAIFSSVSSGAIGDGGAILVGDLRILNSGATVVRPTRSFAATNGAQLIASTAGRGNAGDVSIIARDISFIGGFDDGETFFPSAIFSGVDSGGNGQGGDVSVLGNFVINADGSVRSRSVRPARSLVLRDGGLITVSTFGQGELSGGELTPTNLTAGNVFVLADLMRLQNNGRIAARTGQGDGGNITSSTENGLLVMSGASRISTTAGTERRPGDGGDITINLGEGFAIAGALGNNDISSDAFNGSGGIVNVSAAGNINFVNRSREDVRRLLGDEALNTIDPTSQLPTNDITAISQSDASLNGVVTINAVSFDTGSVSTLPTDLADASQLIARNCPSEGEQELGEFVVTGRGGLPANPNEILGSEDVLTDWVEPTVETTPSDDVGEPQSNLHTPIVEAQQWVTNSNGEVVLIAANPTGNVNLNPAACPAMPLH